MGRGEEGEGLQSLLGNGVQLICPDLPGHGNTPLGDADIRSVTGELARLAASCESCIGYSMGGRLLMMAAAAFPLRFSQLVVESAHPGLTTLEERMERQQTDAARARELCEKGLSDFCSSWYAAPMWAGLPPPQRRGTAEELAAALERFSLSRQPDLRPWLRTTRNRILWLAGSRDARYVPLADWVRNSTPHQVICLDTGHNLHDQDPVGWAEQLQTCLTRNETTEDNAV
jgi:2-succinyl-6-hydroxy-2,4-cyclohexadiene-1-carboxylate synthase